MSELQLGLLVIGIVLVVGVFAYNRRQEGAARRAAEAGFPSGHPDVLLQPETPRGVTPPPERPPQTTARTAAVTALPALPDPQVDYVVELSFPAALATSTLAEHWRTNEHRFAGRAILACGGDGADWRHLSGDDGAAVESLRAGLQLVSREGPVSEGDLIEFRTAVETLAGATGASVSAPEIRRSVDAARELDKFCEDSDIQVVVHVIAADGGSLPGERLRAAAEASGLIAEQQGCFALRDDSGGLLYALSPRAGGVSLALDVPRVPDFPRVFRSMARFATDLAATLGGGLVDDNNNPLDERALEAIAGQLDSAQAAFEARGIATGSATALRLFS